MRSRTPRFKDGGAVLEVDTPRAHIEVDKATAQRDVEKAMESGDFKAQSDAYRRLSKIESAEERAQRGVSIDIDHSKDDASEAFQKQIDALRKAEKLQKDHLSTTQEHADQVKVIGEYIKSHPDMLKHPQILAAAADEVGRGDHGLAVHSAPFFDLVKANFENRLANTSHSDDLPAMATPSKRKRGGAADVDEEPSTPRRFMSAPVSREWYGDTMAERQSGNRPGRVTLSIEQKDMARRLGMSVEDYGRGLLEMRQADKEYDRR